MTNTKCGITNRTINRQPFLEISFDEFEQFKDAKAKLIDALAVEEKFDFLLQNYAEYERDLLSITAEHMLFFKKERKHLNEDNKLVNRRMANTLMSGRLYVDHLQTDLTALFGRNSRALRKVQDAIQNEKEGTFAYRVMDKIRNYALHRSFPLKYVTCGSHWEGDPPTHARHTISPILDVDQIAMDQRFDREVLKELQSIEGEVNLTQLLRQHMEALGRIHLIVREVMAHSVAKWDAIILSMSQRAN